MHLWPDAFTVKNEAQKENELSTPSNPEPTPETKSE